MTPSKVCTSYGGGPSCPWMRRDATTTEFTRVSCYDEWGSAVGSGHRLRASLRLAGRALRGRPDRVARRRRPRVLGRARRSSRFRVGGALGRVNPELEPTDDEIEAELNTMLGAPAAAAALADVKQEA